MYKKAIKSLIQSNDKLIIFEGTVKDLKIENKEIKNVILENDISIKTKSVVLTTGTFLGALFILEIKEFQQEEWEMSPLIICRKQ